MKVVTLAVLVLLLSALPTVAQTKHKPVGVHKVKTAIACPSGALHCASLSWTAPSGTITGYNVYRNATATACPAGVAVASTCSKVASNVTATTYIDSPLSASTTYFWVVTAVGSGGESITSNQFSATTGTDPAPSAPTGLTGSAQ